MAQSIVSSVPNTVAQSIVSKKCVERHFVADIGDVTGFNWHLGLMPAVREGASDVGSP